MYPGVHLQRGDFNSCFLIIESQYGYTAVEATQMTGLPNIALIKIWLIAFRSQSHLQAPQKRMKAQQTLILLRIATVIDFSQPHWFQAGRFRLQGFDDNQEGMFEMGMRGRRYLSKLHRRARQVLHNQHLQIFEPLSCHHSLAQEAHTHLPTLSVWQGPRKLVPSPFGQLCGKAVQLLQSLLSFHPYRTCPKSESFKVCGHRKLSTGEGGETWKVSPDMMFPRLRWRNERDFYKLQAAVNLGLNQRRWPNEDFTCSNSIQVLSVDISLGCNRLISEMLLVVGWKEYHYFQFLSLQGIGSRDKGNSPWRWNLRVWNLPNVDSVNGRVFALVSKLSVVRRVRGCNSGDQFVDINPVLIHIFGPAIRMHRLKLCIGTLLHIVYCRGICWACPYKISKECK